MRPLVPESDVQLVARIATGDRAALGALVERHEAMVHRYARSLTRDAEAAEDAMQQAFLDVLRGARTFRGASTVRAWLLTVTRHAVFRHARRRAGEPEHHVPFDELASLAGWGADPEELAGRASDRALVRRALDTLAPAFREVVTLRDLEGFSGEETARILGITLAATKSRLHRARLELSAALRKERPHGA
ncbi:MAG: RNA polymerase sigma factor [Myxococcota bacterium]